MYLQTLAGMLGTVKVATDAKKLELVVDLDPLIDELQAGRTTDGLWVVGDPVRLGQVVHNLTSNAIKFSPEGQIKVVLHHTTFCGNPLNKLHRLFPDSSQLFHHSSLRLGP